MNDVLEDNFVQVLPIKEEELAELKKLAREDGHTVLFPTHVIKKKDEIVGYFSIANVPVLCGWLSTKDMKAVDSMMALNIAHNTAAALGLNTLIMPLADSSPFFAHVTRFGYKATLNKFTLFAKGM